MEVQDQTDDFRLIQFYVFLKSCHFFGTIFFSKVEFKTIYLDKNVQPLLDVCKIPQLKKAEKMFFQP